MIKDYGFIAPVIKPEDWLLGGFDSPVINPKADWTTYLPPAELQNTRHETYNCTAFAISNSIEGLFNKQFKTVINFSDRLLGIFAGTKPPGNDPNTACEAVRKQGLVLEDILPFDTNSVEEYFSFPSGSKEAECIRLAKDWLRWYDYHHSYVWNDPDHSPDKKQKKLKDALKYSPVSVSVRAWEQKNGVYVKEEGAPDTHLTTLEEYDSQDRPIVFDSYDQTRKVLQKNYDFGYAKVHFLSKRTTPLPVENWMVVALKGLKDLLAALQPFLKKNEVPVR